MDEWILCDVAESLPSHRRDCRKRRDEVVELQQQTLAAVNRLVAVQTENLKIKKAKLAVQQEMLLLKKLRMVEVGWGVNEKGEWVLVGKQMVVQQGEE